MLLSPSFRCGDTSALQSELADKAGARLDGTRLFYMIRRPSQSMIACFASAQEHSFDVMFYGDR